MRKVIKKFQVEYLQILDEQGNVDESIDFDLSEDNIKEMYHLMTLSRTFDEKMFKLQRSGKIGTVASCKGQEAAQVGSAYALESTDWLVPAFRETAALIARRADMSKLTLAWNGDTRAFENDDNSRNLPVAIPVASQIITAAGIAWASKFKKTKEVTLVYFGDGASSEGDFHESLNLAGVQDLPIVYLCQNNQWAISTPRDRQTRSETIAQKAIAYGIKGVQVDGNDALAVYHATKEAVKRAREGKGPTLIECLTYRLGDHTTSDDASKYRSEEQVHEWEPKDPLHRLKKHFEKLGTWGDDYGVWLNKKNEEEVAQAVEKALNMEPRKPQDMFSNIFSKLTPELEAEQKNILAEFEAEEEK